jgi:hypothetical protein
VPASPAGDGINDLRLASPDGNNRSIAFNLGGFA